MPKKLTEKGDSSQLINVIDDGNLDNWLSQLYPAPASLLVCRQYSRQTQITKWVFRQSK